MSPIHWLPANAPANAFPPVAAAERDPNGLLAVGGDLRPERLLHAYASGIFPWYEAGQPVLWWSPDPRAVLWPNALRITRSLKKKLNRPEFAVTADRAFAEVIAACAEPRRYGSGTWITEEMINAYVELHRLGWAHSFEIWRRDELIGGLYGVAIGRVFFGESMFTRITDASKIAFVKAVRYLQQRDYALIDCQVWSPHVASLGAIRMPRAEFITHLERLRHPSGAPGPWAADFGGPQAAARGCPPA